MAFIGGIFFAIDFKMVEIVGIITFLFVGMELFSFCFVSTLDTAVHRWAACQERQPPFSRP